MINKRVVEEYRNKLGSKLHEGDASIFVTRDDLVDFVNLYDLYMEKDKELRAIQTTLRAEGLIASLNLHIDVYNKIAPSKEEDVEAVYEIVSAAMDDMNELLHDECFPNERKCLLMDAYIKARDFCQEFDRQRELQRESLEEDLEI